MSKISITPNATGTGVFTISSPATNTNRTLTLPDEAGTVLTSASDVAQRGVPVFRVYMYNGGSNLSISNGVNTKIPYDTVEFDSHSFFDNTTNYRFQPTIAGYYQITVSGSLSFTSTGGNVPFIRLYKNGSLYAMSGQVYSAISIYGYINLSALVYFNGSSDYVEGYAYYNSPNAVVTTGSADTSISGFLVRAD
jgi:hypothetical protein